MNGNNAFVLGILGVVVLGGVAYWAMNQTPTQVVDNNNNVVSPTTPPPSGSTNNPSRPTALTKGIVYVSQSTAVLNGSVTPNGAQTAYHYEYGPTDSLGTISAIQLIGGGYLTYSAPLAISGLSANTTYYYRITAENQFGRVQGATLSFKTTNVPPSPFVLPTSETRPASDVTKTSAVVKGIVNPKGSATEYWFEYGRSTSLGNSTTVTNAGFANSNSSVSKEISGLEAGTVYYFRLNAQNGYGTVNGNIFSFRTEENNPTPPEGDAPESTTGSSAEITKVRAVLNGRVDPNGSATTYYFEYGKSTPFGLFTLDEKTPEKSAGGGNTSIAVSETVISLDADSTYYYRLVSENEHGESLGDIRSFTTKK